MRIGIQPLAAAVRNLGRRLGQKQARLGRGRKDPPPAPFLHERLVVERRLETQQAEPKSVLPARLAVASPRVAPQLGEDRHDLVGEMDGHSRREVLDRHRHTRRNARHLHRDPGRPIPAGGDQTRFVNCRNPLIGTDALRPPGHVPRLNTRRKSINRQLLNCIRSSQDHRRRHDPQARRPHFVRIAGATSNPPARAHQSAPTTATTPAHRAAHSETRGWSIKTSTRIKPSPEVARHKGRFQRRDDTRALISIARAAARQERSNPQRRSG